MRDDKKRWEKHMSHDARNASPMAGVSGRRYPEESHA